MAVGAEQTELGLLTLETKSGKEAQVCLFDNLDEFQITSKPLGFYGMVEATQLPQNGNLPVFLNEVGVLGVDGVVEYILDCKPFPRLPQQNVTELLGELAELGVVLVLKDLLKKLLKFNF